MNVKREKQRLEFGMKCINFIQYQEKQIENIVDWIDENQPVESIINQQVLTLEAIQRAILKAEKVYLNTGLTKRHGKH